MILISNHSLRMTEFFWGTYTKCFLEQGPCTAEAKDFKKAIPEAVETTCGKCTPKQKQLIRKVIKAVMIKHPTAWQQLVDKYDKDNTYRDTFNAFIEENETIEY